MLATFFINIIINNIQMLVRGEITIYYLVLFVVIFNKSPQMIFSDRAT